MNRTVALIAGCVLSVMSWGAGAQTAGVPLRMDTGFYAGATLGRSEARDVCTTIGGACDSKDVSWNVFAGYQFNRNFALETAYTEFGKAKTSGFSGGGVASSYTTDTKAFELVAVGILPFSDQFSLYGKAGFFYYDTEGVFSGGLTASASEKDTDLTFGIGAEYLFAPQLAARLEWQRYYNVGTGIFGLPNADISVLRLGARYRF